MRILVTLENSEFSWYSLQKRIGILCLPGKGCQYFILLQDQCRDFQDFYSNLASNLVKQLQLPLLSMTWIISEITTIILSSLMGLLVFLMCTKAILWIFLRSSTLIIYYKAAGIAGLLGIFLKDGAKILSKPITDLINLSISQSAVPESRKA